MPDNKRIRRPHDAKRINMNEPYEVEEWTRELNVSKLDLKAIIDLVGDSSEAVRDYIKRHRKHS